MTKISIYPLRLPVSLKAAVEKLSKQDGGSINQFVVTAVAEKVATCTQSRSSKSAAPEGTEEFFAVS